MNRSTFGYRATLIKRDKDKNVVKRLKSTLRSETGYSGPSSYFPGEHVRVVGLAAADSADYAHCRHFGLAAADVSRVHRSSLTKPTAPLSVQFIFVRKIFHTHTHTRLTAFFPGTTRVGRYQKGKPIWVSLQQETVSGSGISWAMQVCTSLQTDNHASTPPLSFFTSRMPFLPPKQQRQSTEGTARKIFQYQRISITDFFSRVTLC